MYKTSENQLYHYMDRATFSSFAPHTGKVLNLMAKLATLYSMPSSDESIHELLADLQDALNERYAPFHLLGIDCNASVFAFGESNNQVSPKERRIIGFLIHNESGFYLIELNVLEFIDQFPPDAMLQGTVSHNVPPVLPPPLPIPRNRMRPYTSSGSSFSLPPSDIIPIPAPGRLPRSPKCASLASLTGISDITQKPSFVLEPTIPEIPLPTIGQTPNQQPPHTSSTTYLPLMAINFEDFDSDEEESDNELKGNTEESRF